MSKPILRQTNNREREVVIFVGKSGYGKTTAAMNYVNEKHYVFLDRTNAWGLETSLAVDDYTQAQKALNAWVKRPDEQLVIYATHEVNVKILRAFALLTARQIPIHGFLVIDECQHYMSASKVIPPLETLIAESRQSHLSLILIARRMSEINVEVRAAADKIYSLFQEEPADIDIIRKISSNWQAVTQLKNRKGAIVTLRD